MLFPTLVLEAVNLLIEVREEIGIPVTNTFLWAKPKSEGFVDPCRALRRFADSLELEHPEYITSTSLRKHFATSLQLLNLKKNEMEFLIKHMGHDLSVHKQFYRKDLDTIERTKVAIALTASAAGILKKFAGKALDDVTIDPSATDFQDESDYSDSESEDEDENEGRRTSTQRRTEK